MPAAEFLAGLGMSDRAQAMLFEAFARSFFAQPGALSAAELVAMFHYYFLGNPEGIGFDAPDTDYLTCIWAPFAAYLDKHGATVRTARPARADRPAEGHRLAGRDRRRAADHAPLVLATEPGALRDLFAASPDAAAAAPRLAAKAAQVAVAPPFAVTRMLAGPRRRARAGHVQRGQPGADARLGDRLLPAGDGRRRSGRSAPAARSWSCTRTPARAPDVDTATARMRAELAALWPETADAQVVHLQQRMEATAPTFPPGGAGSRPLPYRRGPRDPGGRRLRRDAVPHRADGAGVGDRGAGGERRARRGRRRPEPIRAVPQRGLLAGLARTRPPR